MDPTKTSQPGIQTGQPAQPIQPSTVQPAPNIVEPAAGPAPMPDVSPTKPDYMQTAEDEQPVPATVETTSQTAQIGNIKDLTGTTPDETEQQGGTPPVSQGMP